MKFTRYLIVTGSTIETLCDTINNLLNDGYQPIGGVSHANVANLVGDHYTYIQSMGKIA